MTILGTYRVIRMKIVGDAITWSIILMTKVLIYDRNMFTIQAVLNAFSIFRPTVKKIYNIFQRFGAS